MQVAGEWLVGWETGTILEHSLAVCLTALKGSYLSTYLESCA